MTGEFFFYQAHNEAHTVLNQNQNIFEVDY